jgi:hypothetical protein
MSKPYVTEEEHTVRLIWEHAATCMACGERITDPDTAERIRMTFRLRHKPPCPPVRPAA